jgi:hypothetical protein
MKKSLISLVSLAALVTATLASPATAKPNFGDFPIYPGSSPMRGSDSIGAGIYESHDSAARVDRWYRSKLPAACQRYVRTAQGQSAIQYICRLWHSSVNVLDIVFHDGETVITAQ